jgi:hypothetical protein
MTMLPHWRPPAATARVFGLAIDFCLQPTNEGPAETAVAACAVPLDRVVDTSGMLLELGQRLFGPLRLGGAREPLSTRLAEAARDLGHGFLEALTLQGLHDRPEVLAALTGLS